MTEKSLGQVLYESVITCDDEVWSDEWGQEGAMVQADFERRAQAVAAVVREQCAQVCDGFAAGNAQFPDFQGGYESGSEDCAKAIRSMKP